MEKIVTKEQFKTQIRPVLKDKGLSIALCHGVFDLVHPGHIIHFEKAKEMADVLVVSITSSKYVRKGPGRPYFDDGLRLKFLSAIEAIDYVMLSETFTVDDIIEAVKPDVYVKGEEYREESDDITGMIAKERKMVEAYGGCIGFTSGQTFSSTKLINVAMSGLSDEALSFMKKFRKEHTISELKGYADKARDLKILVVGDVIIDRYTYCQVQGIMSKDMGYSARHKGTEEYLGGAVAVARHLATFSGQVTLMSMIGNEEEMRLLLFDRVGDLMSLKLLSSEKFPTIVKHRYLMKNQKREEYRKIFAINNIPERMRYTESDYKKFISRLSDQVAEYDAVYVCDFGHGLINKDIIKIIEENAKFMVLNCQANSSNKGMNVITKYHRADFFALDQTELKLAYPDDLMEEADALHRLYKHLGGMGILTKGAEGACGIEGDRTVSCPAFTLRVKDTVGAGDAFFAVAGIYAALGAPIDVATVIGNVGGALGANIVGNKEPVEKVNVLKFVNTLMNV